MVLGVLLTTALIWAMDRLPQQRASLFGWLITKERYLKLSGGISHEENSHVTSATLV